MVQEKESKEISAWFNVLNAAMKIPGAKVDRTKFLQKELKKYCTKEQLEKAISEGTGRAEISINILDKVSKGSIAFHTTTVSSASALAGLPGGWFMTGTIPADIAQYYYHVIVISQKLAYIYGWTELDGDASDDFLTILTLFIGVMSGAKAANEAVKQISKLLSKEVAKRLPKTALTKLGLFQIARQIAKWLGVKLTKAGFSKIISKAIPVVGAFISGGITLFTFKPMAKRLKSELKNDFITVLTISDNK